MDLLDEFRHPAWLTGIGTAIAYGIVLVVFTLLLFAVPYLLFSAL